MESLTKGQRQGGGLCTLDASYYCTCTHLATFYADDMLTFFRRSLISFGVEYIYPCSALSCSLSTLSPATTWAVTRRTIFWSAQDCLWIVTTLWNKCPLYYRDLPCVVNALSWNCLVNTPCYNYLEMRLPCVVTTLWCYYLVMWLSCVVTSSWWDYLVIWLPCDATTVCHDDLVIWIPCNATTWCCDFHVMRLPCVVTTLWCDYLVMRLPCVVTTFWYDCLVLCPF